MKIMNIKSLLVIGVFALVSVATQSSVIAQQANDPKFNKMMKDGFRAEGIAGLDRIQQDETQKFCSDPVFAGSVKGQAMRDVGYALDAVIYDMTYGGNTQSLKNGDSYYT